MGTDSVVAPCIAGGLFVGFGIVPAIAGEIRFRRAMKAARERAERERQALAREMKVVVPPLRPMSDLFETSYERLDLAMFNAMRIINAATPVPPPAEPAPPPAPPTLDVLAATAQQNPERWKDFL